jgi:glutaredoxin
LRENQISFQEINIQQDRSAAAQVREWTGGYETTPTLNVRGTIVVEFDQNRVAKLLGIK